MFLGLAAKNATLIVEFAKLARAQGKPALDAARLRFRPILMTDFAFIRGVVPLMLATGSGAVTHRRGFLAHRRVASVQLYRALGGGWSDDELLRLIDRPSDARR